MSSCAVTQEFRMEATAGANFSKLQNPDAPSYKNRIAPRLGIQATVPWQDKFNFKPGLYWSAEGSKYEDEDFEGTIKNNYLRLEPMIEFELSDKFSLLGGPSFGFLLSARDEGTSNISMFDYDQDISDFTRGLDLGANLGVSYEIANGLDAIGRLYYGFSNVNEDSGSTIDLHNCLLFVGLSYELEELGKVFGGSGSAE